MTDPQSDNESSFIATAGSVSSAGITLIIPPSTTPTQKAYKRVLNGTPIYAGNLVLVCKTSGTYVVIGRIGNS